MFSRDAVVDKHVSPFAENLPTLCDGMAPKMNNTAGSTSLACVSVSALIPSSAGRQAVRAGRRG